MNISPRDEIFRNFLLLIPNVEPYYVEPYYIESYKINKDLLSDQMKLDILKMAKKLGYTNISRYYNNQITDYKYKSFNEFSII